MQAIVLKSTGSWYQLLTTDGTYLEARIKGKFRLQEKDISNPIAVGDSVNYELDPNYENTAQITFIHPRKNYIIRKSNKLSAKRQILASNVDFGLIIASIYAPQTSRGFIDRFLSCCQAFHIPAGIFFNKMDTLPPEGVEFAQELATEYAKLGFTTFIGSAITQNGIDLLRQHLNNKTSLLAGHSGVGKSTVLNALFPQATARTGAISSSHLKGKHTTTFAQMHVFPQARIIDTPGIRDFGIVDIESNELAHTFPEFISHMANCKFNNCLHINEPDCAIKQAVEMEIINPQRYYSYLSMYHNEDAFH